MMKADVRHCQCSQTVCSSSSGSGSGGGGVVVGGGFRLKVYLSLLYVPF
jgi:hypothetical protein